MGTLPVTKVGVFPFESLSSQGVVCVITILPLGLVGSQPRFEYKSSYPLKVGRRYNVPLAGNCV